MKHLSDIIARFRHRRIVVIGDLIADRFIYGEIARVSREAPVLILRHERTETIPGGAANCAHNLARLGAQHVALVGIVGTDEAGKALIATLTDAGIDTRGVVRSASFTTTTKMRVLAGGAHSTRQQVIRVDYEHDAQLASGKMTDSKGVNSLAANENDMYDIAYQSELVSSAQHAFALSPPPDACIISDYNYGVASDEIISLVRAAADTKNFPVIVDSRYRLHKFSGFTSATPNEAEVEELTNRRFTAAHELASAGEALRRRLNLKSMLITRGKDGMMLLEKDAAVDGNAPLTIPAVGAREAVDVTGAGDTVIAAFTLALSSGASAGEATHIANHAGGLVVMKRGTATITAQELTDSITDTPKQFR